MKGHNPAALGRWCYKANPQRLPKEPMQNEEPGTPTQRNTVTLPSKLPIADRVAKGLITTAEARAELEDRAESLRPNAEAQLAEALANPPVPVASDSEAAAYYALCDEDDSLAEPFTDEERRAQADALDQIRIDADTKARFGADDSDRSICDVEPNPAPTVENAFGVRRILEGLLEGAGDGIMLTIGGKLTAMSRERAINLAANICIAMTTETVVARREVDDYFDAYFVEVEKLDSLMRGGHEDLT